MSGASIRDSQMMTARDQHLGAGLKITSELCNRRMKVIETKIRENNEFAQDVCSFYTTLYSGPKTNQLSLQEVLERDLPGKFKKFEYYLRIYALRALTVNRKTSIAPSVLLTLGGEKEIGILAVIDFIVTRAEPDLEHSSLLTNLLTGVSGISQAIERSASRKMALSRYRQVVNETQNAIFKSATTCESILLSMSSIKRLDPETLRRWLIVLKQNHLSDSNSLPIKLSTILVNLSVHFKHSPVSVDILSLSLELENTQRPTKYVQEKTSRLMLAMNYHQVYQFSIALEGFLMCLKRSGVNEQVFNLSCDQIASFDGICAAMLDPSFQWQQLLNALRTTKLASLASYWLVVLISSTKPSPRCTESLPKRVFEQIVELAQQSLLTLDATVGLEWAYCSIFNEVSNIDLLKASLEGTGETAVTCQLKFRIWIMLAKSAEDPSDAFNWCQKLVSDNKLCQNEEVYGLIRELGFFSLDPRGVALLNDSLVPTYQISSIMTLMKSSKCDTLSLLDFYVKSWLSLFHEGCHLDALRFLMAAAKLANDHLGPKNLRTMVYFDTISWFSKILEKPNPLLQSMAGISLEEIDDTLLLTVKPYEKQLKFSEDYTLLKHFNDTVTVARRHISQDPTLAYLTSPLLFTQNRPRFPKILQYIQSALLVSHDIDSTALSWATRGRYFSDLRWLSICAQTLGGECNKGGADTAITAACNNISGPIYFSRALHTGTEQMRNSVDAAAVGLNLPPNTIAINIEFEAPQYLVITRIEPGSRPITARFPIDRGCRNIDIMDTALRSWKSRLSNIIESSVIKGKTCDSRASFWAEQRVIDDRLREFCADFQMCWLGGFVGLMSPQFLISDLPPEFISEIIAYFARFGFTVESELVRLLQVAYVHDASTACSCKHCTTLSSFDKLLVPFTALSRKVSSTHLRKLYTKHLGQGSSRSDTRMVLVCDRSTASFPWEFLPVIRSVVCSRALSMAHLSELLDHKAHARRQDAQLPVTYLLNPDQDLPLTYKATLESFIQRGWRGVHNERPSSETLVDSMKESSAFVYVGHGSGTVYFGPNSLRKMFRTSSKTFLLGCESVAIDNSMLDDDSATEHAIRGSTDVIGSLWNVKDKDFNRITTELLARAFDDGQDISPALHDSRSACVLPYLTGAALVHYGLP